MTASSVLHTGPDLSKSVGGKLLTAKFRRHRVWIECVTYHTTLNIPNKLKHSGLLYEAGMYTRWTNESYFKYLSSVICQIWIQGLTVIFLQVSKNPISCTTLEHHTLSCFTCSCHWTYLPPHVKLRNELWTFFFLMPWLMNNTQVSQHYNRTLIARAGIIYGPTKHTHTHNICTRYHKVLAGMPTRSEYDLAVSLNSAKHKIKN